MITISLGDNMNWIGTDNEIRFLESHSKISAQAAHDLQTIKLAYIDHLAIGGNRQFFEDGTEIFVSSTNNSGTPDAG